MADLTIIPVGSSVLVGAGIEATVVGVTIRKTSVMYECEWWDGRTRKSDWFYEFQIKAVSDDGGWRLLKIGFAIPQENER